MRTMRIKRQYYDAIIRGEKTLEVRVGYDSIKRYRQGESLRLETAHAARTVRIKAVRIYPTFGSMLQAEPWQQIVPDAANVQQALTALKRIYPANKERLGVYVFELALAE